MLKIKNWKEFQHYKDRNPAWIKLHFSMLTSADWVSLDDRSRVLAIACMLIASKTKDGSFEENADYIQRVAYLNSKPNFAPLVACGFLVRTCDPLLADASGSLANARPEERREETEERREEKILVADATAKTSSFKTWTIDKFEEVCKSVFEGILTDDQAIAFFKYWTEPNARGKLKFQLQETWETKRRMETWQRNNEAKLQKKGF